MQGNVPIGEILKECRKRAGLGQEQLARKLNVDQAVISRVEKGIVAHPAYSLVKAWALATNGADLVGMDLGGNDGWKKLKQLETVAKGIKAQLEAISFMRLRKGAKGHAK